MGLNFTFSGGQTLLTEEEKEDLAVKYVTTQKELNELEQLNIKKAINWTLNHKFDYKHILKESFIIKLHQKMFNYTWKWVGEYRKTNKNLGVDKADIKNYVLMALDDCKYWIDKEIYPPDEICIRFKHKVVSVHPFCNGNGRFSRLIADILANHFFNLPVFTWGGIDNINRRKAYLNALRKADLNNFNELIEFSRKP